MRQTQFKIWLVFIVITFTWEYVKAVGLMQERLKSSEQSVTLTPWGMSVMTFIGQNPSNFTILAAAVEQLTS